MENKSTSSPTETDYEQRDENKPSDDQEPSSFNELSPADEKTFENHHDNTQHTSPQLDIGEDSYHAGSPEQLDESPSDLWNITSPVENYTALQEEPSVDAQQTKPSPSNLKIKKPSFPTTFTLPVKKAPIIAEHTFLYKEAAPVIRNPLIPHYQSQHSKYKARKPRSTFLSIEQYPGHTKNLSLERHDLDYYKQACGKKWTPNPTGCNVVLPLKLKKPSRTTKVQSIVDWKIVEENLKEQRDHELAVELGYETLIGNILYIDIPNGNDINRSWQNYLSEDPIEWGFPYYKGTTERPRMRQPDPYLAHQVVEKLWKFPKATRRRANSVDDLSLG
ncbi:hypothetical protein Btru_042359 [Bulinus truncatus]|nr:hypothetical protein Btru_042359 [Bulinus truncatus]